MRRIGLIVAGLLLAAMLIALPAIGSNGTSGTYLVRGYFDNGSFVVSGEQVRVAGATVGTVQSVDVSNDTETASLENGPHAVPGKAVVVMGIDDSGFKDFRQDASCLIRPQSLIGEKYVDCTPTQPRAPGTPPPPLLQKIPDGESGAGQYLLPLENNGTTVDLDLVQNIQRLPFRDRFRLILNELGAGLAARGQDLGEVIDRANPALRQTDRVLAILAEQNQQLASLASNGDTVLEPLARNRAHITAFLHNAAVAGQATAERSPALEESLRKFPATLHQVRLTSAKLKEFADQGTPLFADLNRSAPGLTKATVNLPAFAREGIPALQTLGNAAETAGPKLAASDGMLSDLASTASTAVPVGNNFAALLSTFEKTQGFQSLMNFIYNTTGSLNGFDKFGHFQRSNLQLSTCVEVVATPAGGCQAFWTQAGSSGTTTTKKKKGKKAKKSKVRKAKGGLRSASPLPQVNVPNIQQLIPQLSPDQSQRAPEGAPSDGTTTTPQENQGTTTTQPSGRQDVSMNEAQMFLQFLLGGGA
jgi:ABC-type transport system involved in resistance to organic solvents, periplasmic component